MLKKKPMELQAELTKSAIRKKLALEEEYQTGKDETFLSIRILNKWKLFFEDMAGEPVQLPWLSLLKA